jgi:hypothetical protein
VDNLLRGAKSVKTLVLESATLKRERDYAVALLLELFLDYKELADSGDAGNWALEDTEVGKKCVEFFKDGKTYSPADACTL